MSMLDRGPFLQRHCQLHCKPLKHFCLYQLQSVQCIPGGWWRFSLLCHHSLSSHKQDKQILYVSEESDNSANSSQSWLFTWGSRLADPAQVKTTENQFGLTAAEGKKKKKEGCSNCWATKALQAVTKWNTKRSCCLWSSYKFLIHGSLARSSPTWYGWFLAHRSWEEAALKKDYPPSSIPLCMAKPGMLEGGCFHVAFAWCFSLGNNLAAWFGDPALLSSSFYLWNSKTWVPSSTETGSGGCLWRSFVGVQASRLIW